MDPFTESARDMPGTRWLDDLARDLRFGLRGLGRSPGYALTTLLTLALGVGATTAVFSVVQGVLLRPLPFPEAHELTTVWLSNPAQGIDEDITSYPNFRDWRDQSRNVERMVAVRSATLALTGEGDPEELRSAMVTDGFFEMLNAPLALGRGFLAEEVEDRARPVTVLSHELWVRRFGADPAIVGRNVELGGEPHEVVGVTAPGKRYPRDAELWVPQALTGNFEGLREARGALWLPVVGRLADGASLEEAQTELSAIARRLEEAYPDDNQGMGIALEPLQETLVGDVRTPLMILFAAVGFVLLIGCANVANLQLVRGAVRAREMAVRLSMGAGRGRLTRQVVAESALLGLMGGGAGALVAVGGVRAFLAGAPAGLPRADEVGVDPTVLGFALALSLLTGILFGLVPALHVRATDPGAHLREGARGSADGSLGRLRPVFVAGQFALALMLLVGAGLLTRSFLNLQAVDPGFAPEGVVVVEISPSATRYPGAAGVQAFYGELLPSLAAIPGAEGAELVSDLLLSRLPNMASVSIESRPNLGEEDQRFPVTYDGASPGFANLLGIQLVAGRAFGPEDVGETPPVALVNQAFVRRFLPDRDPVGERFMFGAPDGDDPIWTTIVGVTADARRSGLDQEVRPGALLPFAQSTTRATEVVVRANGDPAAIMGAVRDAVRRVDADLPIRRLRTLDQAMAEGLAQRRFVMALLAVFAGLATLLAALGIYGVIAYLVGRRTREIGIRVALGAGRDVIVAGVLREAMLQAGVGLVVGTAGSLALGGLLRTQLFGMEPTDPVTFALVAVLLVLVALVASWVPARRAARVDPTVALQAE